MGARYNFKFTLFGKRIQMLDYGEMGIVIEREPQTICVYGTTADHNEILCAIPLCHPKILKGLEYNVEFTDRQYTKVSVGNRIKIIIDYNNKRCANNMDFECYGSDKWGEEVALKWDDKYFD